MSYFLLEDFRLGQDSRKSALTAAPGTLTTLVNGHITRGGELEKRKAFVDTYTLPANTFGLAAAAGSLYTFGSVTTPADMPDGVTYQRLQHPTAEAMTGIGEVELFDGLLYVSAEFADGSIQQFYDGTLVDDFADGIARGGFNITNGSASGQAATGSFTITGGTASAGVNKVSTVLINGVDALGTAVDWVTSNSATATAVAAQITSTTSSPNYTATANGAIVTVTASVSGTAPNGFVIAPTTGGDVTIGSIANMAGGTDQNQITSVKVNGVEILGAAVDWTTSNTATAAAIVSQINTYSSSPEYTASSSDARVILAASAAGTTSNGYTVAVTLTGTVTAGSVTNMANGLDSGTSITPGTPVLTFGTKVYTVSGPRLVFSAVNDPTDYNNVSGIGAGFVNMSNFSSGSENLTALQVFYDKVAIFAEEAVQVWFLDADDENNAQAQVIQNTGTRASRSAAPFGDGDVFYLADNGVRALKARDTNNIGTVAEVGTSIDTAVQAHIATLTDEEVERAVAVIEPLDKRYWLALGDKIYVYSHFSGAKIAAWSTYEVGASITDFAVLGKRVYARAGSTVYLYGGEDNDEYDTSACTFVVPYMDAKSPGNPKQLTGIDMVAEGTWDIKLACNPDRPDDFDDCGVFTGATFHKESNPVDARSTYFAFQFTNDRAEYARFSRFCMYFEKDEAKPATAG